MKRMLATGLIASGLFFGGLTSALLAGNGQGPNGAGYGGPPKSEQERAARQAACIERNGGVCPNGGPRIECPRNGQGRGNCNGSGQGWRRGARDGTGPRAGTGNCPANNGTQTQK